MPDFQLLCALLSSIDRRQILLLRYYEILVEMLSKRLDRRLLPSSFEKAALAILFKEIGRPEFAKERRFFHPDTLQRWYKDLISQKWDYRARRGRPRKREPLPSVLARLCMENPQWGYGTLSDHLSQLGYQASEDTVKNMLRRMGLRGPGGKGKLPPWSQFIEENKAVLAASDFLSVEIPNGSLLETHYVLFVMRLDTREVHVAGMTPHPDEAWMAQMARNLTSEGGFLSGRKHFLCDRDTKFCKKFRQILSDAGIQTLRIAWRAPNMNAYAERWVRSVREECLRRIFIMNEGMVWTALKQYEYYFNHEHPHQGLNGRIPIPIHLTRDRPPDNAKIIRRSRLGGILNFYHWDCDKIAA